MKNHKSQNTKEFVNDFYFPNPNWDNLPDSFPNLSNKGLTREEKHLLDGIKLAWMATQPEGMKNLYKKTLHLGLISIICLIVLVSSITLINHPYGSEFTKTVQAATNQVDEIIQSTMSAILKN